MMKEILASPCDCAPGQCARFCDPDECVMRLSGDVRTAPCAVCHPDGRGATWHQDGACLRCRHMEKEGRVMTKIERCDSCGNEIDPDVCHCGEARYTHDNFDSGHQFVPMGCACGYDDGPDVISADMIDDDWTDDPPPPLFSPPFLVLIGTALFWGLVLAIVLLVLT
jgi:hypothetical protein